MDTCCMGFIPPPSPTVESSVFVLAISEHSLVKAATLKVTKQKLKILECLCAYISLQKLEHLVTCFFT